MSVETADRMCTISLLVFLLSLKTITVMDMHHNIYGIT